MRNLVVSAILRLGLLLWLGMMGLPAQASWEAYTSGESGFGVAATYANMRRIDFETGGASTATTYNTLTTEDTANRLLFVSPASASWSQTSTTSLTGMAGNKAYFESTTNSGYKTLTVDFTNGGATQGTSYVAMMLHMGLKDQDGVYIRYNFSDGSSQTLYSCKDTTPSCIGAYVRPSFLTSLLNLLTLCLFGCNQYDSVYMTYTPSSGVKITSIVVGNGRCDGCGLLGLASLSQDLWIDNISYVDPTVAPHHLELTAPSASAAAGETITFTIRACNNAVCSETYTTGMSGTFSLTGTGLTPTYPGGQTYTIGARSATTTLNASITPSGVAAAALTSPSFTPTGSPPVYCGMGVAAAAGNSCDLTIYQPLHHVRVASVSSGMTCTPNSYTITACSNADCTAPYTAGLTGNLAISGGTVNYPAGASFSITMGSSSTVVQAQLTQALSYTVGLSGLSVTPSSTPQVYCGMGDTPSAGGSCSQSMADAGLFFDVENHTAEASQTVAISAVRKADNSLACTPAFASVSKNVTFKCSYSNPSSGYVPVRLGGVALNAANSVGAACDGTGRSVSLAFDASGVATTTLQYADVGQVGLTGTYTGAGSDAGLSMTGSDTFVTAPHDFAVSTSVGGNIVAGQSFGVTVQARNAAGTLTRNFGRELSPETAALSFLRTQPSLGGAVDGSQSASLGGWSDGQASGSVRYDEVGRGDVAAALASGSYLGSGKAPAGSTAGSWVDCAAENADCVLPSGAQATVAYGANGRFNFLTGRTGTVACNNATFADPIVGVGKRCYYVATGGSNTSASGAVGPFLPDHFDVAVTQACTGGSPQFTYSGQPFGMTITARNALGATTQNYDGTSNTSPNFAKAVTLSAATNAGLGSLGTTALSASDFAQGVASLSTQSFTFADKLTMPSTVPLRALDTDAVSSAGHTEGAASLRSGRLRLFNKFGSEKAALEVPVQAQYWTGQAWLINSADTACTVVPTASVVRARYLDYKGAVTTAWSSSPADAVSLLNGQGALTMSAPTGGATGTVELAINLGSTSTDQSCLSAHPASTGMSAAWLRGLNGSCAATHDRDPSARVTFGVYRSESRKTVYSREAW